MLTRPSRKDSLRLIVAALLAPLIAIATVALLMSTYLAGGGGTGWTDVPRYAGWFSFVLILFGAPSAYLLEGLIGVPAFFWLSATGRLRAPWVVLFAAAAGALAFPLQWAIAFGGWRLGDILLTTAFGATGGSVGGIAFWGIAYAAGGDRRAA